MNITKTEKQFKENLIYLREKNNLSKRNLSSQLHIDFSYYCRLEKLDRCTVPRFSTMETIANYYKIPVYYLLCPPDKWV